MSLPMSSVIRRLRRQRNITQEELADAVGVTYQSVSRWENGQAYPDMELIPKIARFFAISTDLLFGMDDLSVNQRVEELAEKIQAVQNDPEEFYRLCREAYEEFPQEYRFGVWLCRCYVEFGIRPYRQHLKEIRQICRNILENCTDEDMRIEAMHVIAIAEEEDQMESWLGMLPGWKSCREILLETRYSWRGEEEKCVLQRQETAYSMLGWVFTQAGGQSIEGCRLVLRLIEEMRGHGEDKDGWLPMRVRMNLRLAELYFSDERREEGYAALEEGIGLAVLYAELPADEALPYHCPLLSELNDCGDDPADRGQYLCWWTVHDLIDPNGCFRGVQSEARFMALVAKLQPFIRE